ncbi:MAG: hypothetical protein R2824_01145 [Saprospiraceae bacterium]|nr:GreA/GreB family elongation factor [Lewinella sp.]
MSDTLSLKVELHKHCHQYIGDKMAIIESALASITESRDNETKSSVGDKYETGRAMMQLEEEKYRAQLANALQSRNTLDRIDPTRLRTVAEAGSLVETDRGWYYLAIAIGKVQLSEQTFFVISTDAPIGRLLLQKKVGDQVAFQGKQLLILNIS